eukprot:gnl/TRDRNA2_/TRDRNA2_148074_c1_seq1.p1 gnl/TRDRNA2_/TRDRNA2_148074_c1~~gnl/TRDRNA2_/TRDRNA2_148074_c1_seq1.p1  ORF type:complete len:150 (+),score=25.93 gnl/TRDRNA2_/TRDRNA2_148074_c1_seq1:36-452(+)
MDGADPTEEIWNATMDEGKHPLITLRRELECEQLQRKMNIRFNKAPGAAGNEKELEPNTTAGICDEEPVSLECLLISTDERQQLREERLRLEQERQELQRTKLELDRQGDQTKAMLMQLEDEKLKVQLSGMEFGAGIG